jgi:Zn-dependent protease
MTSSSLLRKLNNSLSAKTEWLSERTRFEYRFGITNLYVHTESGLSIFDRLAEDKFWDHWNDVGFASLLFSMVGLVLFLAASSVLVLISDPPKSSATEPASLVAIPGVNEFIPLQHAGVFLLTLFIALLVHEAGHAVAMRRADVEIREWGFILFLGFVPLGAYVEPEQEQLENTTFRDFCRIFSAGIMNNYVLTGVSLGYFLLSSTPSILTVVSKHVMLLRGSVEFFALSGITTLLYWVLFLNFNLAIVNALPVFALDGGRVFEEIVHKYMRPATYNLPLIGDKSKQWLIQLGATVTSLGLFLLLAFGPLL